MRVTTDSNLRCLVPFLVSDRLIVGIITNVRNVSFPGVPKALRWTPKTNTVELAVTYCRGGDCEFVPPLRRGGGDFPAEVCGIASPRNPPVSPLRKGGIIGSPVPDVSYG